MDEAIDLYQKKIVKAAEVTSADLKLKNDRYYCPYCGDELDYFMEKVQRSHFRHSKHQQSDRNREICENYITSDKAHLNKISESDKAYLNKISENEKNNIKEFRLFQTINGKATLVLRKQNKTNEFFLVLPKFSLQKIQQYSDYKFQIMSTVDNSRRDYLVKNFTPDCRKNIKLEKADLLGVEISFHSEKYMVTQNFFNQIIESPLSCATIFQEINNDSLEQSNTISEYRMLQKGLRIFPQKKYLAICTKTILDEMKLQPIKIIEVDNYDSSDKFMVIFNFDKDCDSLKKFFKNKFDIVTDSYKQKYSIIWPPAIASYNEMMIEDDVAFVVSSESVDDDFFMNSTYVSETYEQVHLNKVSLDDAFVFKSVENKMFIIGRKGDNDNRMLIKYKNFDTITCNLIPEEKNIDSKKYDMTSDDLNFGGYLMQNGALTFFCFKEYLPITFKRNDDKIKVYKGNYLYRILVNKRKTSDVNFVLGDVLKNNKISVLFPSSLYKYKSVDDEINAYLEKCKQTRLINKIILQHIRREI